MEDKIYKASVTGIVFGALVLIVGYFLNALTFGAPQPVSIFLSKKPVEAKISEVNKLDSSFVTKKHIVTEAQVDEKSLWEYCHVVHSSRGGPTYETYYYFIADQGNAKLIVRMMSNKSACDPGFKKISKKNFPADISKKIRIQGFRRVKLAAKVPPEYEKVLKVTPLSVILEMNATPNYAGTAVFFLFLLLLIAHKWVRKNFGDKIIIDARYTISKPDKEYRPGDTVEYSVDFTSKSTFKINELYVTLVCKNVGIKNSPVVYNEKKQILGPTTIVIGASNQFKGSFKLPDKKKLFRLGHKYELHFYWNAYKALDIEETVEITTVQLEKKNLI